MKTEHTFKLQEQVILRRPIMHGRGSNLVKIGTILAFADNGAKAIVSFPADRTRLTLSLTELEPVKARYSRDRVQVDVLRRGIGSLIGY